MQNEGSTSEGGRIGQWGRWAREKGATLGVGLFVWVGAETCWARRQLGRKQAGVCMGGMHGGLHGGMHEHGNADKGAPYKEAHNSCEASLYDTKPAHERSG